MKNDKNDHDLLVDLCARFSIVEDNIKRYGQVLDGNGHPGLINRVTRLESNWKWLQIIACGMSGIVGSLITYILK